MCVFIPALSAMTYMQVDYCNDLVMPAPGSSECFTSFWITADPGALSVTISFQTTVGPLSVTVPVSDGHARADFLVYWRTILGTPMLVENFTAHSKAERSGLQR
jgi:hypothetical protein